LLSPKNPRPSAKSAVSFGNSVHRLAESIARTIAGHPALARHSHQLRANRGLMETNNGVKKIPVHIFVLVSRFLSAA
jgi:hypothetical protein